VSSVNVAATEVQSLHRGPFAYDRSAPLSAHCPTRFEPTHRFSSSRNSTRPELIRSWSEKTGSEGLYGKDFMSKQTDDRGLQGSSTRPENDAGRPSTSLANFSQHGQQQSSNQSQPQSGIQLPPLPQATNVTSGSFPPPRSGALPSILNPSTEQDAPRGQVRKADQLDSPPSSIGSLPPLNTSLQPSSKTIWIRTASFSKPTYHHAKIAWFASTCCIPVFPPTHRHHFCAQIAIPDFTTHTKLHH
jgi:hypothetical protein